MKSKIIKQTGSHERIPRTNRSTHESLHARTAPRQNHEIVVFSWGYAPGAVLYSGMPRGCATTGGESLDYLDSELGVGHNLKPHLFNICHWSYNK